VKTGVLSTVTPGGKVYLLKRGRFLTGKEKLRAMGLKLFDSAGLSDPQLSDLAGNAFAVGPVMAISASILASVSPQFKWDSL
jgi:hypothetical protein